MDEIERTVLLTVHRALGFTGLAIGMTMVGLSFQPALALQTGACLVLMTAVVLGFRSLTANSRSVGQTEAWILLKDDLKIPKQTARRIIGETLRKLYRRYAEYALGLAVALWLGSIAARMIEA
jgi:hypothetical protein